MFSKSCEVRITFFVAIYAVITGFEFKGIQPQFFQAPFSPPGWGIKPNEQQRQVTSTKDRLASAGNRNSSAPSVYETRSRLLEAALQNLKVKYTELGAENEELKAKLLINEEKYENELNAERSARLAAETALTDARQQFTLRESEFAAREIVWQEAKDKIMNLVLQLNQLKEQNNTTSIELREARASIESLTAERDVALEQLRISEQSSQEVSTAVKMLERSEQQRSDLQKEIIQQAASLVAAAADQRASAVDYLLTSEMKEQKRLLEKQSSLLESLVSSLSEKRTDDSVPRDQSRDLDLDRGRYRSVQINGEADTPAGFDFDSRGAIRSAQRDEEVNTDRRREMANNEVDEGRKGSNNEAEGNANVNTNAKASRYSAKTNVQDDAGDVVYDDYYSTYQWDEGSRRGSSSSSSRSSRGDGYDSGYSNSGYRNRETTATPGNNYARGSGGAGGYGYRAMDDDFVSPPRRFSDRQRTRNVVRSTGRLIRGVGEFSRVAARSVVEILGFWVGLQIYDDMEDSDGDVTSRNSNDRFSDRVSGTGRRMSSREQPTASLVEAKALPSGNQYGYDELNDGSTLFIDSLGNTNSYSQFRDQIVAEDLKDYSDDTADWERDTRKSI